MNESYGSSLTRKLRNRLIIELAAWFCSCVALAFILAPHAAAQGCAMCYQNASATGPQGREALRHGILVLLLPTLSLFVGILALIYRRRNVAR
jgi:hypothetical protein